MPEQITVVGDRIFFVAYHPTVQYEPWVTDGTPAGTWRLGRVLVARGEHAEAEKWLAEAARELTDPVARPAALPCPAAAAFRSRRSAG